MVPCVTKGDLIRNVQRALTDLSELVGRQREAVWKGMSEDVRDIDRNIELKFGEKQRAIGALEVHQQDHGC